MFRATGILVLSLCFGPAALSQSVPKDLLSLPVSLGLDKPLQKSRLVRQLPTRSRLGIPETRRLRPRAIYSWQ